MRNTIMTVLGARPQFIKAAVVSRELGKRKECREIIVHTGQHYDANMSEVFFEQLNIPIPSHNLHIGGGSHGAMTGRQIEQIELLILAERPSWMLVYGDTNSTLAAALAAVKQRVPIAHVEAGLRSYNLRMPEEVNRVLTDRVSTLLFTPSELAAKNLKKEGFPFSLSHGCRQDIRTVGDVMYDAVLYYRRLAEQRVSLERWGVREKHYVLCTIHRQENTDDPHRMEQICSALRQIAQDVTVLLPMHPRTRLRLASGTRADLLDGVHVIDPLPYLEMQRLEMAASVIVTDSGGVQKEAYFHAVPCVTLRDETEWGETVDSGWNEIVGADSMRIIKAVAAASSGRTLSRCQFYGEGNAAVSIANVLCDLSV